MRNISVLGFSVLAAFSSLSTLTAAAAAAGVSPELISVKKISDSAPHSAFTDLIEFNGAMLCCFRESDAHVGGNGRIRVLSSKDAGETWDSLALVAEAGVDLRDPKLSVTPGGELLLLCGGSVYQGKKLVSLRPRVLFSKDGVTWSAPTPVLENGDWLWRVTWHPTEKRAYGLSYRHDDPKKDWKLTLYRTGDGVKYEKVVDMAVEGRPNESTIRFMPDGTMVALIRREAGNRHGVIGTANPPYTEWTFKEVPHQLGGPNFFVLPDGSMAAAGRDFTPKAITTVASMTTESYTPTLPLPSGGDCSYPGLVWKEGVLYVSYYSSHEGKTSIYFAKIKVQ